MSTDVGPRVTRDEVQRAAERLRGLVRWTPLLEIDPEPRHPRVALKLECLQASGSFKLRGATNCILLDEGRHERVVATSGGNHGIAVAHACRQLGLAADVFVSASAPMHKVRSMEAAGARVHRVDHPSPEVAARCLKFAERHEALFVHPFDDPAVVAGQGTLGLEILEQSPDVTHIVVAVGGGGLAAGLALALAGTVQVMPIEPARCPTLAAALDAGHPVPVEVGGVAVDSLGSPLLGNLAYAVLSPLIRSVTLVSEDEIRVAQRQLWRKYRLAVEPAAASAWAAVLGGELELGPDARVVVIVCGGNVDLAALAAGEGDDDGPATRRRC
jgi:threonine dehydratase